MARRNAKAEGAIGLLLLVVGLPIFLISKIVESVGWILPVVALVGLVAAILLYQYKKKADRLAYLRQKYQDESVVQKIAAGYFWQGQTEEQLIDSIGRPIATDNKVLKSFVRETWKYNQVGRNRYGLRITLENGHVTGWENKS